MAYYALFCTVSIITSRIQLPVGEQAHGQLPIKKPDVHFQFPYFWVSFWKCNHCWWHSRNTRTFNVLKIYIHNYFKLNRNPDLISQISQLVLMMSAPRLSRIHTAPDTDRGFHNSVCELGDDGSAVVTMPVCCICLSRLSCILWLLSSYHLCSASFLSMRQTALKLWGFH